MEFGNWTVNQAGIKWRQSMQQFSIPTEQLLETIKEGEQEGLYKWILLATEEDWLTDDDLYDLNFAFVYAAAHTENDFSYERFDRTIAYQYELLDQEDQE